MSRLVGLTQTGPGALRGQEAAGLVSCCLQGEPPGAFGRGGVQSCLQLSQQTHCVSLTSWHRPSRAMLLLLKQQMNSVQAASAVAWVSPRSLLRQEFREQWVTLAAGCSCLCGLVLHSLRHLHSVQSLEQSAGATYQGRLTNAKCFFTSDAIMSYPSFFIQINTLNFVALLCNT